jgi:hypothetical protein
LGAGPGDEQPHPMPARYESVGQLKENTHPARSGQAKQGKDDKH